MGLFDVPAPLFDAVDGILGSFLPPTLRLLLWGVLAGWLTMVVYRRLSNQDKISELKAQQKESQKLIADFDGEMEELLPLIWATLKLGFRQLGLAIGPALLATIPILFLVAWVAGEFAYHQPDPGTEILISAEPAESSLQWRPEGAAEMSESGWKLGWPAAGGSVEILSGDSNLLALPTVDAVPIIHKKQWWNMLFGNPIGYVPDSIDIDEIHIGLPPQSFLPFGPEWMRGWMFTFFITFLLASLGFKFALKID